jgi:glycosyltransferase involved in cell wall biosynthesis
MGDAMTILHVGPFKLGTSCGHFNALWALARAQAAAGHDVAILRVGKVVAASDRAAAARSGVRLVGFPCPRWRGCWRDGSRLFAEVVDDFQPDIVHLFYVRVPKFCFVSHSLGERRLPYVVSLHGGLNSTEMRRHGWRKLAYWHALEKRVHENAAGIHFVSQAERDDYYATLGTPRPADAVVPNIPDMPVAPPTWRGLMRPAAPKLAYFGRYDIWTKGLDLALELVASLRRYEIDAELHLYGTAGGFAPAVRRLLRDHSDLKVTDHGYVGGREKFARMASHDLYLQYSRFESFGMSLVEALALGVPALVSERSGLAGELVRRDAALQIPMDPAAAARVVAAALQKPEALRELGERGQEWVQSECAPAAVAARMERLYATALAA